VARVRSPVLVWSVVTCVTGVFFAALGWIVRAQQAGQAGRELLWTIGGGAFLVVLAIAGLLARTRLEPALQAPGPGEGAAVDHAAPRTGAHPYLTLFVASFCCLFLEVMLIRFAGSQIRIFSFYKNIPLISCYLGMGLGCFLRAGRPRHVLSFLLWLVPVTVALSLGSFAASPLLGEVAAGGSSEHILGNAIVKAASAAMVRDQAIMGAFAVTTLVAITLLFVPLGRLLGEAFQGIPRLRAYTVNIAGSLAGVAVFMAASYLWTPPWVWFVIGLAPLIWWLDRGRDRALAAALIAISVAMVVPSVGQTVWSPYQKLVGRALQSGPQKSYSVEISDVFYQVAIDLRPETIRALGHNPLPHYDAQFAGMSAGGSFVIVGAGSGNDVAAALRAGASRVDAVDIDPAIVRMGREHHPERPYDDPRVRVIVDDARSAFRRLPAATYDAVVFGLLDSHTQLGVSSVRLDNYVFTLESFQDAARLLKPGGRLIVTAATFRPWFYARFVDMLAATCGAPVAVQRANAWFTYSCSPSPNPSPELLALKESKQLPTDDWPFLYLPAASVPGAYVVVLIVLALASVVILRALGLRIELLESGQWHLFFMGAAFLLVEVHAINRLALLFGSTWLVSAVTIALVLLLILGANLVTAARRVPYAAAYAGLFASLVAAYLLNAGSVAGLGLAASVGYGLVQVLPVFFAGLIFARSFEAASGAGTALGANMFGSVLGGWIEYASMATGIRALLLLAIVLYLASALALLRGRRG
jgi:SAM-dependent methyltransferase